MIKYGGEFTSTSEQQLVDCAGAFDNFGCDGGLPSHAFEYIKYNGGISSELQYPYMGVDQTCEYSQVEPVYQIEGGAVNITSGDEESLKKAIYQHGPVSVAYDCEDDFMNYQSGVYTSQNCGSTTSDVNHAVLAVGYGTENGKDYWLIKNSWSADWGMDGFFKIERGVNMCAIAVCNSYPYDVTSVMTSKFNVFLQ